MLNIHLWLSLLSTYNVVPCLLSLVKKPFQSADSFHTLEVKKLTRILLESPSRPFRARGSSPMLAVINLASEMMAATSSRPSFLIFQFLSSILDTRSEVTLSLKEKKKRYRRNQEQMHNRFGVTRP